ncbi:hypothetical protein [Phytohabitans rumicis]|uniref:HTH merR-type domain-containing protein n=1 Tax=Phytohabitans rumicis TaxID=1076125 RepID=A0A6V8LH92_9ACTN|nr:hypothetical protein [Phytohabitans rumicis]GFJ93466.1 hypothetical protein Prum_071080 [Phytohabitans rumicis]
MTALLYLAELADRAGVPAARMRDFDDAGLLPAARRDGDRYGYHPDEATVVRLFDDADRLGIPTADLTDLAAGWRSGDCQAAQDTLAHAVTRRTTVVQDQITAQLRDAMQAGAGRDRWAQVTGDSLPAFEQAACLQAASKVLAGADHTGPCGPECACTTALTAPAATYQFPGGDGDALSCDLAAAGGDAQQRIGAWQQVLAQVQAREPLPDTTTGLALRFPLDGDLAAILARLAAAEYRCCSFGSYTLVIDGDGLTLQVRMPDGAADQLAAVPGTPDTPAWEAPGANDRP